MSLNEKKRDKELPDVYLTEGICRSKSFAGLSHRRTSSVDVTFSSSDLNSDAFSSNTLHGSLGAVFRQSSSLSLARNFIQALSSSKSSKINKAPRPRHTLIIFDTICKGLRDNIHLAKNDISTSRMAFDNVSVSSVMSQGRLYELEKLMKANERLLKKLEFHLSKLEELKERYDVQHRMRDGIKTMAYAYILSPGKEKDSALHNIKLQFKECTDSLCSLEHTLESMMGMFLFEMNGIQGFARICCGDIFEVVIKHGDQKWKSRGRVMKNEDQLWENKFILFRALFCEPLYIKAIEVRGLGKNMLLGNKFCEIQDLFCAHPQQMTINLNPSGSLKLNLTVTWNPLNSTHTAEGIHASLLSSGLPNSLGRSSFGRSSIQEARNFSDLTLEKEHYMPDEHFCDNTEFSFSSESTIASASTQSSAIGSPDAELIARACSEDNSLLTHDANSISVSSLSKSKDANYNESFLWFSASPNDLMSDSLTEISSVSDQKSRLTEVFKKLLLIIEDVSDSYPELNEILIVLEDIKECLKDENGSKTDSNISISIEKALGCFDFLNSADDEDLEGNDKLPEDQVNFSEQKMDAEVNVDDYTQSFSESDGNSLMYSSGIPEVDIILTEHLLYCTKLISTLLTSAPENHLENVTLSKLKKQQSCLTQLSKVLQRNNEVHLDDFFEEKQNGIKELWNSFAGTALYCTISHISSEMKKMALLDSYMAWIVCPRLIMSILDVDSLQPHSRVSVLQFKSFFEDNEHSVDGIQLATDKKLFLEDTSS